MKEESSLTKIVLGAGPLNPHVKPRPFQVGGIFGCFMYIPGLGWVEKNLVLLLVLVAGAAAAVLAPFLARR